MLYFQVVEAEWESGGKGDARRLFSWSTPYVGAQGEAHHD
jgi:hypothetical protein